MLIPEHRSDGIPLNARETFKSALEALEQLHHSEVHELRQEVRRLRNSTFPRKRGVTSIESAMPQRHPMQPQPQNPIQDCIDRDGFVDGAGTSRKQVRILPLGIETPTDVSLKVTEHSSIDDEDQRNPLRRGDTPTNQSRLTEGTGSRDRAVGPSLTDQEDKRKKSLANRTAFEIARRKMTAIDLFGLCAIKNEPSEELSLGDVQSWYSGLSLLVNSPLFEAFFAFAILTNSIFLGFRIHYTMVSPDKDPRIFKVLEYSYMIMFAFELCARVGVKGSGVFCDRRYRHWYFLDLFVVLTSLLEVCLEVSFGGESMSLSNFRVLRLVKLIKVLRLLRLVAFFRALRTLVLSIVHMLKSVICAFSLLFMTIYVFSLIFAQLISSYMKSRTTIPTSVQLYWGTLPRTIFTLFEAISNGMSWHDPVIALMEVDHFLVALFLLYISFTVFAFLNLITGVFCEAAIESARKDNDMMIHQHLDEKEKFTHALHELFGFDSNVHTDFVLSYLEFEGALSNPITKAHLGAMQLDTQDAWELFKLLDTHESALIDVEEFVNGCLRLKGMAKSLDLAKLSYESKIRHKRLAGQISTIDNKLSELQRSLYQSFSMFSHCSPSRISGDNTLD